MRHDGSVAAEKTPVTLSKSELRGEIRTRRTSAGTSQGQGAAAAIAEHVLAIVLERRSPLVACYFSLPHEPSTDLLLARLWEQSVEVITPRVRGTELEWVLTADSGELVLGTFGIREAVDGQVMPLAEADLVLMPALAVSTDGTRLGQGGGFYDRALARLEEIPLLIAVVNADEDGIDVPRQQHDVPVDAVASQQGVRWITTGASSASM